MNPILIQYVNRAYARLLDFSTYHCRKQGLVGEEVDVLNEAFIDLLKKDETYLLKMLSKRGKNGYTELDYYILKLIRTYTMSETAPYKHKYRSRTPKDENRDLSRLDLIDNEYDDATNESTIKAKRAAVLRHIIDNLPIDELERNIACCVLISGETPKGYLSEMFGATSFKDECYVRSIATTVRYAIHIIAGRLSENKTFDFMRPGKDKPAIENKNIKKAEEIARKYLECLDFQQIDKLNNILKEI